MFDEQEYNVLPRWLFTLAYCLIGCWVVVIVGFVALVIYL